jgi:hypothetical protein
VNDLSPQRALGERRAGAHMCVINQSTGVAIMVQSTANVRTESASRYLQQLCKHWSHKMTTEFDPASGRVDFPSGAQLFLLADAGGLHLKLTAPEDALERMEGVVADHLKRFAFREELEFAWQRQQ